MKEISLSEVLMMLYGNNDPQVIKSYLSGRPQTEKIEGELMVYLKINTGDKNK